MMRDDEVTFRRLGLWRRALALLVDSLCVGLPCAVVASLLFWASGGHVQATTFFNFTTCEDVSRKATSPVAPPSTGTDSSQACRSFSVAGQTARTVVAKHDAGSSALRVSTWASEMTDADGQVIQGVDWSWVQSVILLLYLVAAEALKGRTLGLRLLGGQMIFRGNPDQVGVPMSRLLLRYAIIATGYLPELIATVVTLGDPLAGSEKATTWLWGLILGLVFSGIWDLWNIVLITQKRDPLFDRWAGTAVVRASDLQRT